jgi:hypothetical protein
MLLIDDLLLASFQGLIWVAKKIDDALEQQQEQEEEELKTRLRELHQRLEAGQLGEREFEAQEAELLDRLDAIAARNEGPEPEEDDSPEGTGDHAEGGREDGTG